MNEKTLKPFNNLLLSLLSLLSLLRISIKERRKVISKYRK